jgi:hypothetical protein
LTLIVDTEHVLEILVKAIIKTDKYDVKILPQRWGATPWGFIEDHKDEWGFLQPHILTEPKLTQTTRNLGSNYYP